MNPDYRPVHYGLGRIYLDLGNYTEALSALERARRLFEDGDVLVYIGAAYAGLGEVDEALAAVELGLNRGCSEIDAIEGSL